MGIILYQLFLSFNTSGIDHDEVSDRAKIIDRDWWEVEEVEILGNLDREFKALSIQEQDKIQAWELSAIEVRSELTDELLDNTKWLILEPEIISSAQEWQMAIASKSDLRLRLSPDERKAIDTYGNILLSGSAGTGKTTVGLYRLAQTLQINPAATCLYVAYNPILVKESEAQFQQLWGSTVASLPLKLDFLTIKDLCLKITQDCGEEFDRRLVDYAHFYQRYIKKPESRKYPASLVWDEIRSIIKGANLTARSESYLLSEKEYEHLGKRRSGVILARERHEIYKLARWYQDYIDREELADEMDLTQVALRLTQTTKSSPYTLIICDEVQDFTEIQLELLIGSIAPGGQILCAGDINQMISPSGFRWEDLTTRLYQKNRQWTKENLAANFRSTGRLVSLASEILKLKFQLLSESQPYQELPTNISGELARLVTASSSDYQQINLGAADAILVRTEERKQELMQALETKLIFTIEESKSLESDTVYLINYFESNRKLWSTILSSSKQLKEHQKSELRLEFNLLYVAISRARRLLNICEAEISDLWKRAEIAENLIPMTVDEAFNQSQSVAERASAPQGGRDWYQRAIYYRDARLLPQALECATKSGDENLRQEIEVESLLLDRKYPEVAQLLLAVEKYSAAAQMFEQIEAWKQAVEAWDLAGDFRRKSECQIKYLLKNGEQHQAVRVLIQIEKYAEAAEILEDLAQWQEAAQFWRQAGDRVRSVECEVQDLKNQDRLEDAANKLIEIERCREAVEILEAGQYWDKAAEIWGKLGNEDGRDRCLFQSLIADWRGNKYKLEQEQAAIDDYDLAINTNPNDAKTYFLRGTSKYKLGQDRAAIDDFDLAININPQYVDAYIGRGTAKYKLGQPHAAIDDYDLAIGIAPQDAAAYNNRGLAKHSLGQHQAAINDYNYAITLNPKYANAYNNRGSTKYSLGQPQAAVDDYDLAIKIDPQDAAAYYNRGFAKYSLGQLQSAIDDCNRAIYIDSEYADAYRNRGTAKSKLGQNLEAIADFAKAAEFGSELR